jgi:hypothetical protein
MISLAVRYIYLKGAIIGPAWKLPFMGPFLQSVNPKFHEYKAKWDSGDLSCVSVFHKYVPSTARGCCLSIRRIVVRAR